jgi:hypothetical protein
MMAAGTAPSSLRGNLGQLLAVGLGDVEDVDHPESGEDLDLLIVLWFDVALDGATRLRQGASMARPRSPFLT